MLWSFGLFFLLGSAGCGLAGAIFAAVILITFAGRDHEARIFFGEVDEIPVSCLGLLWSIIGCLEMMPVLLLLVGGVLLVLKIVVGLF